MLSSGIKFRAPIIPNENSLKNVPTSSNLENSGVSNIEPNFPPLTYTQIINVIKVSAHLSSALSYNRSLAAHSTALGR